MASLPTIYDLVLLLSTTATDEDRSKILSDIEVAITGAGGRVEHQQQWGTRPLSFRIEHQGSAEYHLLQFSGPRTLLESLSHSLRINDGVLRFRIIKVLPGTPPAPEAAPPLVGAAAGPAHSAAPPGGEDSES
jgi:small subunit ribosomal protein S6